MMSANVNIRNDIIADYFIVHHEVWCILHVVHHQLPLQAAASKSEHSTWIKINDEVRKLGTFIDNTIA